MEKRIYYLSNTVIPNTKREKNIHVFNVLTQVGVKQLTDFLRTVTAASDLVDCTLVNCGTGQKFVSTGENWQESCLVCKKTNHKKEYVNNDIVTPIEFCLSTSRFVQL